VLAQITAKTDGVPLFIEELTKAVLEAGMLQDVDGQYVMTGTLPSFAIPATLQDSLMARLDRLVTAKAVARYAAVIGRQFSYELLEAVSRLDPATLQRELGRLVAVELLYQRGLPPQATYTFKHALIQDTAYQSLLKSTRQHYHQRIIQVLEAQFPEIAEAEPELLAHHCTEARLIEHAIIYWHRAAQRAAERSAHVEAISHLTTGLALLQTLPETPECTQHQVEMYLALGASLIAAKGYTAPEVEQTYLRAQQLCQHLAELHQLFPVLRGLWMYYFVRAEYQTAHDLGEQLLTLARHVQDAAMLVTAHRALGSTFFHLGAFTSAHTHLAQGLALYDPQQQHASALLYGEDAGVTCRSYAMWTLWWLGYPDQGRRQMDAALAQVQQMAYPFDLSFVLSFAAVLHQCRREVPVAQERAEAAIRLATEQGFPYWMAYGAIPRGWALVHQGHAQAEMEQIKQGLRVFRATGAEIGRQYFLALLAEAHGILREPEAGLTVLIEALVHVEHTGDRYYTAEIHRLKGELLLRQHWDNQAEAETCFQHAMAIAQHQQAKSLELRAATSLARLWHQQGKRQVAYDLLAPVYSWFTEGFDTADLKDAKALLHELEDGR
jgi:predicted ATPase